MITVHTQTGQLPYHKIVTDVDARIQVLYHIVCHFKTNIAKLQTLNFYRNRKVV